MNQIRDSSSRIQSINKCVTNETNQFLGYDKTAKLLIIFGADINIKDKEGKTPRHYALENGKIFVSNCFRLKLCWSEGNEVNDF